MMLPNLPDEIIRKIISYARPIYPYMEELKENIEWWGRSVYEDDLDYTFLDHLLRPQDNFSCPACYSSYGQEYDRCICINNRLGLICYLNGILR